VWRFNVPRIRFPSLDASRIFLKMKHVLSLASRPGSRAFAEWRALYVAALFEKDEDRMMERIDEARRALVVRARELFLANGDHQQERSDIDDALQFLHVLEKCSLRPHAVR